MHFCVGDCADESEWLHFCMGDYMDESEIGAVVHPCVGGMRSNPRKSGRAAATSSSKHSSHVFMKFMVVQVPDDQRIHIISKIATNRTAACCGMPSLAASVGTSVHEQCRIAP